MAHHHHHHSLTQLALDTLRRSPPRYTCQQQQQQQQQFQSPPPMRRSLSGGRIGVPGAIARSKSHQRAGSEPLDTSKPGAAESALLSRRGSSRGAHTCLTALTSSGTSALPATSGAGSLPSPPTTASGDEAAVGVGLEAPGASGFRPRKRSLSVGGEQACGDFFARQIEQYGLAALLTSPVGTCYLLASAVLSYSPEIVLFYLEVEHFRGAAFGAEDRRTRYAKGLYKAFVSSRAPLEINISHAQRARVAQAFRTTSPVPAALFAETQAHAHALLEQEYALFRQRPLFAHMLAALSAGSSLSQHQRAVAAVYDALAAAYGLASLPPSKPRLVESELPSFTKFADMDLTSTDMRIALPAWLCRTTVRLLGTPMPCSYDDAMHLLRVSADPRPTSAAKPASEPSHMAPAKQKSFQRLRFRFQHDASAESDPPLPAKSRWDVLWSARRRKP
ncbi:hypothetical protein GGI20_002077 [Coemansia sp. BCRC 34301]|nr:hypothetical protein GGI20_002077 [Coemansia sp. BCRC 34301]